MTCYELTDQFIVRDGIEDVWAFFSTATNLPVITPPWLDFTIRMPASPVLKKDVRLDYTIRWMKLPVKWQTRIIEWDPARRFVDLQTRGPYALWHHEHRYEPVEAGVICFDRVLYRLPFGPIGSLTHATIVRRQLLEIFRHRRKVIGEHLGGIKAMQPDVQISTTQVSPEWVESMRRD